MARLRNSVPPGERAVLRTYAVFFCHGGHPVELEAAPWERAKPRSHEAGSRKPRKAARCTTWWHARRCARSHGLGPRGEIVAGERANVRGCGERGAWRPGSLCMAGVRGGCHWPIGLAPRFFDLGRGELVFFRRFPVFFEQNPTLNRKKSFRCAKGRAFSFFSGRKKFFLSPKRASPTSSPYSPEVTNSPAVCCARSSGV